MEKSPFEAEQEWEKEREKLEKQNEELSRKARVAAEKVANLENRLMSEAEDEDVVRARLAVAEKDRELGEMKAKVKELESELLQAVFQGSESGSYGEVRQGGRKERSDEAQRIPFHLFARSSYRLFLT